MSLIDDLFSFFSSLFHQSSFVINEIEQVKSEVKAEFAGLIAVAKEATKDSADFVDRAKHLRSKLIRADLVFKLIEEIRTGELKRFAVDTMRELDGDVAATLTEVVETGRQIGLLKTQSAFIHTLLKILGVWLQIKKVVVTLKNILPVIQQVNDKLKEFEGIILPQTSARTKATETYYKRNA